LPPGPEWLALFAFVAAGADGDEVRSDVPATPAFRHNMIEGEDTRFDAAIGAGAAEAGFDFGADMVFARSVVEIHDFRPNGYDEIARANELRAIEVKSPPGTPILSVSQPSCNPRRRV
jgi:hypothetical protein